MTDSTGRPWRDTVPRGHLAGMLAPSPPIYRYPSVAAGIRHFWIPVWDIPAGREWPQRTLQYPHPLLVITGEYARFYGIASGLSGVTLAGRGWAFGVALRPSSGVPILRAPMTRVVDGHVDLAELGSLDGAGLTAGVRSIMGPDPHDEAAHRAGIALVEAAVAGALAGAPAAGAPGADPAPIDEVCEAVETDPTVVRVADLATRFGVSERSLQRLVRHHLGIGPKWLIRRRRLQEAGLVLRATPNLPLAALAADLGYVDQAHFTRDFTAVVGVAPGEFRRRTSGGSGRGGDPA